MEGKGGEGEMKQGAGVCSHWPLSFRGEVCILEGLWRAHRTHLAPQKFSNPYEETPQPLLQVEACTAEGLPPKFHD